MDDDDKIIQLPRRPKPSDLGESAPDKSKVSFSEALLEMRGIIQEKLAKCSNSREILELEADGLAECVGLASEIYKSNPSPDNSYQLAALTNSHKSLIAQLEKMRDPILVHDDIEKKIRAMFQAMTKALGHEIYKTKTYFVDKFPEDTSDVENFFGNMLEAIQPESQKLYADLSSSIKKTLGIKSES